MDSMSTPQEITSLRRGVKLKNETYTNSVILLMTQQIVKGGEGSASCLVAANICSILEQLFDVFQESQPICLNALVMLNMLISISVGATGAGSNNPIVRKLLTQPESCGGLLFAIATHLGDHAIVVQGVRLILFLTSHDPLLQRLLVHQNQHLTSLPATAAERKTPAECSSISITDVLTSVMRIYGNDVSLMEDICHAVYNLTYEEEEGNVGSCRSYFVELGIGELLVRRILVTRDATSDKPQEEREKESASGISSSALEGWKQIPSEGAPMDAVTSDTADTVVGAVTTSDCTSDSEAGSTADASHASRNVTTESAASDGHSPLEHSQQKVSWSEKNLTVDIESDGKEGETGLAKWGLRALGALCRHHAPNQQAFGLLGACDAVMRLRSRCLRPGTRHVVQFISIFSFRVLRKEYWDRC